MWAWWKLAPPPDGMAPFTVTDGPNGECAAVSGMPVAAAAGAIG